MEITNPSRGQAYEILDKEYLRVAQALTHLKPSTEEYRMALSNFREIGWALSDMEVMETDANTIAPKNIPEKEYKPEPVSEPIVEEEPPMVEVPKEENKELTAEYVRECLSKAAQDGTMIQPIISKFVPEGKPVKFSSIPRDKYPELMEELNA